MASSLQNSTPQPQYTKAVIQAALRSPSGSTRVWCIVEAEDDVAVYSKFLDPDAVSVLPSQDQSGRMSCRNVENIVIELYQQESNPRLFGIRDCDYTRYDPGYCLPTNVFLTDCRDVEMMMLRAPSVIDGLRAWSTSFPAQINISLHIMKFLGYLRIFNDLHQTSCIFKGNLTKISLIWDQTTHCIRPDYQKRLLSAFISNCHNPVSETDFYDFLRATDISSHSSYYVCRGHDVCRLLATVMIHQRFSNPKSIFARMVTSYSYADFQQTALYADISSWAANRSIPIIWRQQLLLSTSITPPSPTVQVPPTNPIV